jgi:hypothetical protein
MKPDEGWLGAGRFDSSASAVIVHEKKLTEMVSEQAVSVSQRLSGQERSLERITLPPE